MIDKRYSPETFIDREVEQELFNDFLKFQDDARLLTIRDAGGRGKSSLLRQFRYICGWLHQPPILACLVSLNELPNHDPFTLVTEIQEQVTIFADTHGLDVHFPRFDHLDAALHARDFLANVRSYSAVRLQHP
jgi:hypothetical protein